jgi:hypothetical protein
MIPDKIKEYRKKIIDTLYTPSKWCNELKNFYKYIIFFFIIGLLLRYHFFFPYFGFYFCIFTLIAIIVCYSIRCYVQYFPEINALSVTQKSLRSATLFYYTCELKVCTTKKPENPSVFLTLPVAHELSVLCMI